MRLVDAGAGRSGVLGCGWAEYGERESIAVGAGDATFFVVDRPAGNGVREDRACFLPEARDVGFPAGVVIVYGSGSNGGAGSLEAMVFVFVWKYADFYVE